MTSSTRVTTKDGDVDVAVHKVEEGDEVEDADMGMAIRIWDGGSYCHMHGNCTHVGSACSTPGPTHSKDAKFSNIMGGGVNYAAIG